MKDYSTEGCRMHLNELHRVFSSVIAQEAPNHCDKALLGCFLPPSELLGEFLVLQDLLYLWSAEDPGFDFCLRQLKKEVL